MLLRRWHRPRSSTGRWWPWTRCRGPLPTCTTEVTTTSWTCIRRGACTYFATNPGKRGPCLSATGRCWPVTMRAERRSSRTWACLLASRRRCCRPTRTQTPTTRSSRRPTRSLCLTTLLYNLKTRPAEFPTTMFPISRHKR